jgi:DNA-binding NarL/FixJ family response regulator
MKISIVLIEDDPETRRLIAGWLREAPDFSYMGDYMKPTDALERVIRIRPDVVLSDINMPEMNGIEGVRRMKAALPNTQFVMLTVFGDTDHIFDALRAGAAGYLLKATPREELLNALREVHAGGSPMTTDVARKVVQSFRPTNKGGPPGDPLSERERSVLELLASGSLYKEIAEQLGISVTTVNTYVRRIYEKLHVQSRGQAVAKFYKITSGSKPE